MAIWKSRKSAFGAIGRLSPTFFTQDGVVPRTLLAAHPPVHQGDSRATTFDRQRLSCRRRQLHPILLFDERDVNRSSGPPAGHEILEECIRLGGTVTGEHGIGVEKMALMPRLFAPQDLAAMVAVRNASTPNADEPVQAAPQRRPLPGAQQPRAPGVGMSEIECPWPCETWLELHAVLAAWLRPEQWNSAGMIHQSIARDDRAMRDPWVQRTRPRR